MSIIGIDTVTVRALIQVRGLETDTVNVDDDDSLHPKAMLKCL